MASLLVINKIAVTKVSALERLNTDRVKRLKELEKVNERLRKAVSSLTLKKLILREAASGNF